MDRQRYVYVMGPRDGLYKIGYSAAVSQRAAAIGGATNPIPIVLAVPCEWATKLERYLHQAFHHRRVHGEWFDLSEGNLKLLRRLSCARTILDVPKEIRSLHKTNERVLVEIEGMLWKRLNTIWNLKRQMRQDFDSFEFIDGLIRGPIDDLLAATRKEHDAYMARVQANRKKSRPVVSAA